MGLFYSTFILQIFIKTFIILKNQKCLKNTIIYKLSNNASDWV